MFRYLIFAYKVVSGTAFGTADFKVFLMLFICSIKYVYKYYLFSE